MAGLVYISGFAPGERENLTGLPSRFAAPGAIPYFKQHQLPDGGTELTLAPEGFHESFCAGLPADDAAFYAITQRPLACVALTKAAPAPGVAQRPGLGGVRDRRQVYRPRRAPLRPYGATLTGIDGALHVAMISHPKEVAQIVMTAIRALR